MLSRCQSPLRYGPSGQVHGQSSGATLTEVTQIFSLTVVYEPVEEGWIQATIDELPGVITAAPSLSEAKVMIVDALREWLLALGAGMPPNETRGDAFRERLEIRLSA